MRRADPLFLTALLATGCILVEPIPTATPLVSPSPGPSLPASAPPASVEPTAEPTPGSDAVPIFTAGSRIATNAPGLRVRSRPGTVQRVITSLGVDANLLVGLGPVMVDGLGWYLVRDADDDEPEFGEGWVAAGFEPDPFLVSTTFDVPFEPYLVGFAGDEDTEQGPILLPEGTITMRWIAAPLDTDGCAFAVDLRPASGSAVTAVRATVGGVPAPGEVFAQFFDTHPELTRGDLFVSVTSDCSWALAFVRPAPAASPSPAS